MKQRLMTGWNLTRWIYFILGSAMLFHGIYSMEWFGIAFGGYIAMMGLFAFGCASGACPNVNFSEERDSAV